MATCKQLTAPTPITDFREVGSIRCRVQKNPRMLSQLVGFPDCYWFKGSQTSPLTKPISVFLPKCPDGMKCLQHSGRRQGRYVWRRSWVPLTSCPFYPVILHHKREILWFGFCLLHGKHGKELPNCLLTTTLGILCQRSEEQMLHSLLSGSHGHTPREFLSRVRKCQ